MHFSLVGTPLIVGSANGALNEPIAQSLDDDVHALGPRRPPSSCARPTAGLVMSMIPALKT